MAMSEKFKGGFGFGYSADFEMIEKPEDSDLEEFVEETPMPEPEPEPTVECEEPAPAPAPVPKYEISQRPMRAKKRR